MSAVQLPPHTRHCFALRALNAFGAGPPAIVCYVRSPDGQPEPDAVSVELLRVNDTAVTVAVSYRPAGLRGSLRSVELTPLPGRHLEDPGRPAGFYFTAAGFRGLWGTVELEAKDFGEATRLEWTLKELVPYCQYKLYYSVQNARLSSEKQHLEFNTTEGVAPGPMLLFEQLLLFDTNFTLSWRQFNRVPGRLLGYRISLISSSGPDSSQPPRHLNVSADRLQAQLTGLQPLSQYAVTVAAVTGLGPGLSSNQVPVTTDPSWPSAPQHVRADAAGYAAGVLVSWSRGRFTLEPPGRRRVLAASTVGRKDYPADLLAFRIAWRFQRPGPRGPLEVTGHLDTGPLQRMPECACAPEIWRPRSPDVPCRELPDRVCTIIPWSELLVHSRPLPSNSTAVTTRVDFTVSSLGLARWAPSRRYPGHRAPPCTVDVPSGFIFTAQLPPVSLDQPVILGISVGLVIVLLAAAVVAFLGWKWLCRRRRYRRPRGGNGQETLEFLEHELGNGGGHSNGSRPRPRPYSQTESKAMSIQEFREHVLACHANDNSAFQIQFEDVQRASHKDWPAGHWRLPDNLHKNRYTDIYPFDHTRVVLLTNTGKKRGDYINANFVDGYHRRKAYIACQGPLPSTFDDFWLMVWENNCSVIVMISNFVERGRRKCDQYWPDSGWESYGQVAVKFIRQMATATYCLRVFSIRSCRAKKASAKERTVMHFLYSEWPDYGVPQYPLPVLNFVQMAVRCASDAGPIVVHCSAGVGRTGTFICIEAQIRQILREKTVNVRGFLEHIRQHRMRLVQTEEQFVFIHDVLLEFLLCPEREVRRGQLPDYVRSLQELGECGCTRLETQYQLCVSHQPSPHEMSAATKSFNSVKNRADILPIESRRVKLTAEPGVEGSDYINASHLHGYYAMNEFIVTQQPTPATTKDFLKLIWDQNSSCVVSLDCTPPPEGASEEELPALWPQSKSQTVEADHLLLYFLERKEFPYAVRQDFLITNKRDDYSLVTSLWTLSRWPETLGQSMELMQLVGAVRRRKNATSPLIVMDTYGASFAGIFCALHSLSQQLQQEDCADVYSLFKMYHLQRPGIFNSQADLQFIYEVLEFHSLNAAAAFADDTSLSLPRNHGNGTADRSAQESQQLPVQESQQAQPQQQPEQQQQQLDEEQQQPPEGEVNEAAAAESPQPQPQPQPQPPAAAEVEVVRGGVGCGDHCSCLAAAAPQNHQDQHHQDQLHQDQHHQDQHHQDDSTEQSPSVQLL